MTGVGRGNKWPTAEAPQHPRAPRQHRSSHPWIPASPHPPHPAYSHPRTSLTPQPMHHSPPPTTAAHSRERSRSPRSPTPLPFVLSFCHLGCRRRGRRSCTLLGASLSRPWSLLLRLAYFSGSVWVPGAYSPAECAPRSGRSRACSMSSSSSAPSVSFMAQQPQPSSLSSSAFTPHPAPPPPPSLHASVRSSDEAAAATAVPPTVQRTASSSASSWLPSSPSSSSSSSSVLGPPKRFRSLSTADVNDDRLASIAASFSSILRALGEDPTREGLALTPMRAAKALAYFTREYEDGPRGHRQRSHLRGAIQRDGRRQGCTLSSHTTLALLLLLGARVLMLRVVRSCCARYVCIDRYHALTLTRRAGISTQRIA